MACHARLTLPEHLLRRVLRMAHSVTVQPALSVRAALTPCHTDLQCLLLRLDLENLQVRHPTFR